MQFSKISAVILTVLAAGVTAAPFAEADTAPAVREEAAPGQPEWPEEHPAISKRGFGCPGDRYQCSEHCRSLGGGRTGGYCGGHWWLGHPTERYVGL
ncbi:hypothetical protein Asppvi_007851 [Aspergillus pseudoviridinutans]|uniref:Invertebrate defensins family profile domain-containing protein n=1 Tax=Aspergillus pseudoviridinutans TaxID=1517512 RepID=A0A9P3BIH1_9EURO|nr:uncharacterized protein Asppvi_007851 [Aspergillus pseudoviridinutans]GIJ88923.1 hypothetical protein Asppvi_007851 [Aspergillus pseudoviridinutans]